MILRLLRIAIPFIWFGAVCAISFMEAPLKFYAPHVTVEIGLGIGRLIFHALNTIEIALGLAFLISLIVAGERRPARILLPGIVFAILFLQTIWLLPVLDARAEALLGGNPPPPSNLHIFYIAGDAAKIVLLLVIGILGVMTLIKERNSI